jgi:hypothetical protein
LSTSTRSSSSRYCDGACDVCDACDACDVCNVCDVQLGGSGRRAHAACCEPQFWATCSARYSMHCHPPPHVAPAHLADALVQLLERVGDAAPKVLCVRA